MAIFKCKMCGGTLEIEDGQTVATCEFCGTKQTVPTFDSEKKATFFNRANALRLKCEFDKAAGVYETIISEFPNDSEAYWGLVLCKFGIEYVDDPKTGYKIPTCHRTQFTSIFDDHDYKSCIKNADVVAAEVYKAEALVISNLQKKILEISSKEDPFDVFICYKETDRTGERTKDSVLAQEIYNELTNEGFKVFFARLTLEHKLGSAYEPYIFAALHSSKVMVHVTTSLENSDSVWVKNEWARYLGLIADGDKKVLIPCYRGISAYDLPDDLQNLQGQDMNKIGAMQDLIYGIKKIIKPNRVVSETVAKQEAPTSVSGDYDSLIRKGYTYLKNKKFEQADHCFDLALDSAELCGDAYLGKVLCEYQFTSINELKETADEVVVDCENFTLAKEFANGSCKKQLKEIEDAVRFNRLDENYKSACNLLKHNSVDDVENARSIFEELGDFKDSVNKIKEATYNIASIYMDSAQTIQNIENFKLAINIFLTVEGFKDSVSKIEQCNNIISDIWKNYSNSIASRFTLNSTNGSADSIIDAISKYHTNQKDIKSVSPMTDEIQSLFNKTQTEIFDYVCKSSKIICPALTSTSECERLIKSISILDGTEAIVAPLKIKLNELVKIEKEKKKRNRIKRLKISGIICGSLAVITGISFGIKAIVDEKGRKDVFSAGDSKMASGDYDAAISYYESLGDYGNAKNKIEVCKGMKQLDASISSGSQQDAEKGIKQIVTAGEKVDVTYVSSGNHTVKKLLLASSSYSDSYTETIDNPNFKLYQPGENHGYTFVYWNSLSAYYENSRAYLTMMSNWSINSYNINYVLDGGTNNTSNPSKFTVETSTLSLYPATKTNYQFLGWYSSAEGGNKVTEIPKGSYGDLTLYARWEINHYSVKFYNGSELLETVTVDHGGTAVYTKSTPTKQADVQYTYKFKGWDKVLTNVTSNFSTYAQFDNTINKYKVTFYDYDKTTVLDSCLVNYGDCATYSKSNPTREKDDHYEYSFSGWDKPLSTKITGDTSFYAQYSTTNRYLCRFFVENVEKYREIITAGGNAYYPYATPTKAATQQYTYTFSKWNKSLENIQADTDFEAVFTNITNKYTVTFINYDNSVLWTDTVDYGTAAHYGGNTPTKPTDTSYKYTFLKWDKDYSCVTENITTKALFTNKNRYLCRFYDYNNDLLQSTYVTEGETVTYTGKTPSRPADAQYTYSFKQWDKSLIGISAHTDFKPIFNNTTNKYTVTFVNWDGTTLGSSTVDYGTKATYTGSTPTRATDNQYKYTFSNWDIDLTCITSNVTATAQFSKTNRYLCIFNNYDETELYRHYVTEGESAKYEGDTPTKPKTQQYTYTFSSWDKSLDNITSHTTFTAVFSSSVNSYNVTFKNYDGSVLKIESTPYGSTAVYTGDTPTKPTKDGYFYVFDGWNETLENITDNCERTATFIGYPDEHFTFTLNSDENSYTLSKFEGTFESIIIPSTYNSKDVTIIGKECFKNNSYLKTIEIPDTIIKIDDYAFYNMTKDIDIFNTEGSKLEYIGEFAFGLDFIADYTRDVGNTHYHNFCPKAIPIFIPSTCKYIGGDAFYFNNVSPSEGYSSMYFDIGIYIEDGVDTSLFEQGYGYDKAGAWDSWYCGRAYIGEGYRLYHQYSSNTWSFNEYGRPKRNF